MLQQSTVHDEHFHVTHFYTSHWYKSSLGQLLLIGFYFVLAELILSVLDVCS